MIIQFYFGNSTEVTAIFHAISQGCNGLVTYGNSIYRSIGYVINRVSHFNRYRRARCSVSSGRAGQADGAIFAVDNDGRTIFTVDADLTIDTVCTIISVFRTDGDIVAQGYGNLTVFSIGCRRDILTIAGDLNRFAKALCNFVSIIISQAEGTGTGRNGIHFIVDSFELIFRGSTTGYGIRIRRIPSGIA